MTTTFGEMYQTKLQSIEIGSQLKNFAIGFIKNSNSNNPLLISLEQINQLVNSNIKVYIERGYGIQYGISDIDYVNRGVDLIDDVQSIIHLSNIVIKYDPFIMEEYQYLRNNQILLSCISEDCINNEMALILNTKRITGLAINYIIDKNGNQLMDSIIANTFSNFAKSIALGIIISSVVMSFSYDRNIRQTIQLNPELMKSIYCFHGDICNPKIAAHASVPWKDVLGLCWDWN
jgi:hypothetical protein